MTFLAGEQGASGFGSGSFNTTYPGLSWKENGHVVESSGTVATAYLHVNDWFFGTEAKVVVYDAARVKLGESSGILASGGTGLRSASITLSRPLVKWEVIYLVPAIKDYSMEFKGSDNSTYRARILSTTYATVDDPLPTGSAPEARDFVVWLDGTTAAYTGLDIGAHSKGNFVPTTAVTTQATGSAFVIGLTCDSGGTITGVTDNYSNTYTRVAQENSGGVQSEIWMCPNGVGGASHVLTPTYTGTPYYSALFLEVLGAAVSPLDQSGDQFFGNEDVVMSSGTLAEAPEMAILMVGTTGGTIRARGLAPMLMVEAQITDEAAWPGHICAGILISTSSTSLRAEWSGYSGNPVSFITLKKAPSGGVIPVFAHHYRQQGIQ